MELKWRGGAKAVAIMDIILASVGVLPLLFFAFVIGGAIDLADSIKVTDPDTGLPHTTEDVKAALWLMRIVVIVLCVLTGAQIGAAIKLLGGTTIGKDFAEALKVSKKWRTVTILHLVLGTLCSVLIGCYYLAIAYFVVRALFLFIVWNFVVELDNLLLIPPMPNLTQVTVK